MWSRAEKRKLRKIKRKNERSGLDDEMVSFDDLASSLLPPPDPHHPPPDMSLSIFPRRLLPTLSSSRRLLLSSSASHFLSKSHRFNSSSPAPEEDDDPLSYHPFPPLLALSFLPYPPHSVNSKTILGWLPLADGADLNSFKENPAFRDVVLDRTVRESLEEGEERISNEAQGRKEGWVHVHGESGSSQEEAKGREGVLRLELNRSSSHFRRPKLPHARPNRRSFRLDRLSIRSGWRGELDIDPTLTFGGTRSSSPSPPSSHSDPTQNLHRHALVSNPDWRRTYETVGGDAQEAAGGVEEDSRGGGKDGGGRVELSAKEGRSCSRESTRSRMQRSELMSRSQECSVRQGDPRRACSRTSRFVLLPLRPFLVLFDSKFNRDS